MHGVGFIRWIAIYPMNRVSCSLNNRGLNRAVNLSMDEILKCKSLSDRLPVVLPFCPSHFCLGIWERRTTSLLVFDS